MKENQSVVARSFTVAEIQLLGRNVKGLRPAARWGHEGIAHHTIKEAQSQLKSLSTEGVKTNMFFQDDSVASELEQKKNNVRIYGQEFMVTI